MKRVVLNGTWLLLACLALAFLGVTRGTLPIPAAQLWQAIFS
jgi:hypothetical protein